MFDSISGVCVVYFKRKVHAHTHNGSTGSILYSFYCCIFFKRLNQNYERFIFIYDARYTVKKTSLFYMVNCNNHCAKKEREKQQEKTEGMGKMEQNKHTDIHNGE